MKNAKLSEDLTLDLEDRKAVLHAVSVLLRKFAHHSMHTSRRSVNYKWEHKDGDRPKLIVELTSHYEFIDDDPRP